VTTGSDNPYPKILVVEGTAPASPAAGRQALFVDTADHHLKRKNSGGTVTDLETGGGGGGGLTAAYLGYNTIGASSESVTGLNMYCKSITTSGAVEAVSVSFYGHQNGTDNVTGFLAGIWNDNSGVVGQLLAAGGLPTTSVYLHDAAGSAGTDRWFHFPISYPLAATTTYHFGFLRDNSGSHTIFYDTSGSDRTISTGGGYWLADGGRYTQTNSTKKYSIRLRVIS
jgi:hypothetical protein